MNIKQRTSVQLKQDLQLGPRGAQPTRTADIHVLYAAVRDLGRCQNFVVL